MTLGAHSSDRLLFPYAVRKRLLQAPTILIALWAIVLWWGERYVFNSHVARCQWEKWEAWVGAACYIDLASAE